MCYTSMCPNMYIFLPYYIHLSVSFKISDSYIFNISFEYAFEDIHKTNHRYVLQHKKLPKSALKYLKTYIMKS